MQQSFFSLVNWFGNCIFNEKLAVGRIRWENYIAFFLLCLNAASVYVDIQHHAWEASIVFDHNFFILRHLKTIQLCEYIIFDNLVVVVVVVGLGTHKKPTTTCNNNNEKNRGHTKTLIKMYAQTYATTLLSKLKWQKGREREKNNTTHVHTSIDDTGCKILFMSRCSFSFRFKWFYENFFFFLITEQQQQSQQKHTYSLHITPSNDITESVS